MASEFDHSVAAYYARAAEGWEEYTYLFRQGVWLVAKVGGGAGPMLVNANDPTGEGEAYWQRVETLIGAERGTSYAFAV